MAQIVTRSDYLVCYDVNTLTREGRRRLRQVAKVCEANGQRVQFSVFECSLTPSLYQQMRSKLEKIIQPCEDSLRIYRLPTPRTAGLEVLGRDGYVDFSEPQVL